MHTPSAAELLTVWERGLAGSPVQRALLLLEAACDDASREELGRLSIGERDARLLSLRERLFGSRLAGLSDCPACAQRVELEFDLASIRVGPSAASAGPWAVRWDEYEATFRLPNTQDLEQLDPAADLHANRRLLLNRCVLTACRGAEEVRPAELPDAVVQAVGERMAEADPQAEIELALECPQCHHHWPAPLDVVGYLWGEVHAWALRMLHEVHALASAYGWREADILALSATRRQAYLDLINA